MIQRIQSVWFFIAIVLGVIVLVSKLGVFVSTGMDTDITLYNLFAVQDGRYDYSVVSLFIIMLFAEACAIMSLFLYRQRKKQMRVCTISAVCCLMWYACLGEVWMRFTDEELFEFQPSWSVDLLPLFMVLFLVLAYRGVKHDDELVRSADRIR